MKLDELPANAIHRFFDRTIIRALVGARSYLHLDLLTNPTILEKAGDSFYLFVDHVVRESVLSANSPWRSAVISEYGGYESWSFLDEEQRIVQRTLKNPCWYVKTSAHMPLLMKALETVQSRNLDVVYNQVGRAYESRSGISPRAICPVYLAEKMEVLAIRAAVYERSEEDLYVTDLSDLFGAIRDHSVYHSSVWEDPLANWEHPTPFAYLLHEIFCDLRYLIYDALLSSLPPAGGVTEENLKTLARALQATVAEQNLHAPEKTATKIAKPVGVDRQLAFGWSLCALEISQGQGNVSEQFGIDFIKEYLNMILHLHCAPSEIPGLRNSVTCLEPWRDLLLGEIRERFAGPRPENREYLERAFRGLDKGKMYVHKGSEWLAQQLNISFT